MTIPNPKYLIRAAAVITFLNAVGHTIAYPWTPALGPQESALISNMKTLRFEFAGANRTYWDFYVGFGLAISAYLLVQAVVLWQLSSVIRTEPAKLRPILVAFAIAFAVNTAIVVEVLFRRAGGFFLARSSFACLLPGSVERLRTPVLRTTG